MVKNIKDNINEWSKFEFTAKLMKLREIVSGFVINKEGNIDDFETNKDKVLEQSFEEIGDKPIIIWCQFQHEIERLAEKYNALPSPLRIKIVMILFGNSKQAKFKSYLFTQNFLVKV